MLRCQSSGKPSVCSAPGEWLIPEKEERIGVMCARRDGQRDNNPFTHSSMISPDFFSVIPIRERRQKIERRATKCETTTPHRVIFDPRLSQCYTDTLRTTASLAVDVLRSPKSYDTIVLPEDIIDSDFLQSQPSPPITISVASSPLSDLWDISSNSSIPHFSLWH
jgi:hypothetical protein